MASQSLRQVRERDLVVATRALFDERGVQHAPIEEIASTVGIARGLVYRHFSSKEELFVLTVTDYLAELGDRLDEVSALGLAPVGRLERTMEAYATFCADYPAFLDGALSLMQRPAGELRETMSESVWLRLGQGMNRCIAHLTQALEEGNAAGLFAVEDSDYLANVLWAEVLGTMHLARVGVGMRDISPGVPDLFVIPAERVVRTCVDHALTAAGVPGVSDVPSRRPSSPPARA
jgi:AcrR family transcriptional regulator